MILVLKRFLRKISNYIQKPSDSFVRHNNQYKAEGKLEQERRISIEYFKQNQINAADFKVLDLLKKNPVTIAVDVGSGTGWASAALSPHIKEIIALEPSAAAIQIAKSLYPPDIYSNITWIEGFAEELLLKIDLQSPTIFITGCVLSHLRDQEVEKICSAICKVAPAGSVFAFSECWSEQNSLHQHMWHVRSKAWWQAQFPSWQLEFGGKKHEQGDYHMGIWGVKNK